MFFAPAAGRKKRCIRSPFRGGEAQDLLQLVQGLFSRIQLPVDVPRREPRNVGGLAHVDLVVHPAVGAASRHQARRAHNAERVGRLPLQLRPGYSKCVMYVCGRGGTGCAR